MEINNIKITFSLKKMFWSCHMHIGSLNVLTHWGLVTPYGDMDLGQHWLKLWLVAWRRQAISWTNVDWKTLASNTYQFFRYINKFTCEN